MSSADKSETLMGEIPAVARLSQGSERLSLFITGKRIIVAHGGKRGAGAVTATTLLGDLGKGFEELVKGGSESLKRRGSEHVTPARVLAAHKDNFALRHDEVVNVDIIELPDSTHITILSRDEKLDFSTHLKADVVAQLLASIPREKLKVHRLTG